MAEKKWRIGFQTPEGHRVVFTTLPVLDDPQALIDGLLVAQPGQERPPVPEGSKLILLQEMPVEPAVTRLRYCPFCGGEFSPGEVPEGYTEAFCTDCEIEVDVSGSIGPG